MLLGEIFELVYVSYPPNIEESWHSAYKYDFLLLPCLLLLLSFSMQSVAVCGWLHSVPS